VRKADAKEKEEVRARRGQARGERTRRAILEAALRVIARRGLGAATIREVAKEAGASLGVVTYHFPSRRSLLSAGFSLHLEQTDAQGRSFSEDYAPAWQAEDRSLEDMTDAAVALLARMVHDERDSFVASHELTLQLTRDPELARDVQGALSAHRGVVEEIVAGIGSAEPGLDAEILSAAFEGLALKWLSRPDDPEFVAHLRRVISRLLSKILTQPAET
jgi:AcrR family transcriptional regulator